MDVFLTRRTMNKIMGFFFSKGCGGGVDSILKLHGLNKSFQVSIYAKMASLFSSKAINQKKKNWEKLGT
jgi:hypothetical protein